MISSHSVPLEHKMVIFFTGLSGSGKSTLAEALNLKQSNSILLDGDKLRSSYTTPLPHGQEGLDLNTQRIIETTLSLLQNNRYVIGAFVAPDASLRERIKKTINQEGYHFFEVYLNTSIKVCEERDPKGLYQQFRSNGSVRLAGINEIYEVPCDPDLVCDTNLKDVRDTVSEIILKCSKSFFSN